MDISFSTNCRKIQACDWGMLRSPDKDIYIHFVGQHTFCTEDLLVCFSLSFSNLRTEYALDSLGRLLGRSE
jgi:hypothetical protein